MIFTLSGYAYFLDTIFGECWFMDLDLFKSRMIYVIIESNKIEIYKVSSDDGYDGLLASYDIELTEISYYDGDLYIDFIYNGDSYHISI